MLPVRNLENADCVFKSNGIPEYYKVADNFWHKAVNDYMYNIGGVAGAVFPPMRNVLSRSRAHCMKTASRRGTERNLAPRTIC